MITKQQFIERLQFIQDYTNRMNDFDKALKKFGHSDFSGFYDEDIILHLVKCLQEDMNDIYENISWWLYEAPEGEKKIWESDIEWDVSTPELLYAYLYVHHGDAPTTQELKRVVRAQDDGVKFALQILEEMKQTNGKTKNEGWGERGALLRYAQDKIEHEYRFQRGIGANLNYKDKFNIISVLENES